MTSTQSDLYSARLSDTLPRLRERVVASAEAAGRPATSVRVVAVTKSHPIEAVEAAIEAGLTDLGENRVEELEAKVAAFSSSGVTWHMIGHLQSRKAGRAAAAADLVHSVDSLKLGERLARVGLERERPVEILAQVNTSGEDSKGGFAHERADDEIMRMAELPGLCINGLMTMAPFVDDEVVLGRAFAALRALSERLTAATNRVGHELSMGMTNDLEIAIREGSTIVRVGTALFGERTGFTQ